MTPPPPQFWSNGSSIHWSARSSSSSTTPLAGATASSPAAAPPQAGVSSEWLRNTERLRRMLARRDGAPFPNGASFWARYFIEATDASFRLESMATDPADLAAAVARGFATKACPRPRQQQRIRNHIAILHDVERLLAKGEPLTSEMVVRWYTSVACGLSIERLDEPMSMRLADVVRQINSPYLRLAPAVQEIARLHRQLLADPVVPSFNGILARLLLRYHLGRCGLPPIVFVPDQDARAMSVESELLSRMLERINQTYASILAKTD